MDYLYNITNDLYAKLSEYYEVHDTNYLKIMEKSLSENNTRNILNSIINGTNNYFSFFNFSNCNYLFDVDFIASHMENGVYIKIPNNKNKNGNYQNLLDYKELIRKKLNDNIVETNMVRYIMKHVVSKFRTYYLSDFMKNNMVFSEEKSSLLRQLYNRLALLNDRTGFHNYNSYEDLILAVHNRRVEIYDEISNIIDSNEIMDEIIKQQEYYINEIERLEEAINSKGNIMKIPDSLFKIYMDFLHDFKRNATLRRDELLEQKTKKISTFKF